MAILRAGPWRSFNSGLNSSVNTDPETDFSSQPTSAPVNVAFNNWPNQDWGAVKYINKYDSSTGINTYISGDLYGLGDSMTMTGTGYDDTMYIYYFWQSTEDVDIEVDWSTNGSDGFDWQYNYSTINGDSGLDYGYAPTGTTEIFLLPAATLGMIRILTSLSASVDTVTVTINQF